MADVVRIRLEPRDTQTRSFDQRLALRFPGLARAFTRWVFGLPPRSRVRQALLKRAVTSGLAAYNRRDLVAVTIGYADDYEHHPYREFVEAALAEPCYRGHRGYRDYIEATYDVWGRDGVSLKPTELIDLGDRFVLLADMDMRAQASGVALSEEYAGVWTVRDGQIARVQDYLSQEQALAAAGLAAPTGARS